MKMKVYILLPVLFLALSSCEKWLDVDPMSQVKAEQLFENEEGYHKALVGIYINMTGASLYGGDLTLSTLEVLAQNYSTPLVEQGHAYERIAKYEYDHTKVKSRVDQIWNGLYNEVANCNAILERIDSQKELFTENYNQLVKAEAMALRGMFHFDLLRLFVPAVWTGLEGEAIPYMREFGPDPVPFSTIRQVLAYIVHDLKGAREILAEYDPIVAKEGQAAPSSSRFQKRESRMNYYAVTALLARVYLYMGNDAQAYKYAEEVYKSGRFGLVSEKEASALEEQKEALTFRKEQIMGLHVNGLQAGTTTNLFFGDPINSCLAVSEDEVTKLYGANSTDIRARYWFAESGQSYMALEKYRYGEYIPLIKYSEILLILSETSVSITDAGTYLNELKTLRQIPAESVDDFNYMEKLEAEYRKEFIGEGQMFYFYKRINKSQLPGLIEMKTDTYSLKIPLNELEFKTN